MADEIGLFVLWKSVYIKYCTSECCNTLFDLSYIFKVFFLILHRHLLLSSIINNLKMTSKPIIWNPPISHYFLQNKSPENLFITLILPIDQPHIYNEFLQVQYIEGGHLSFFSTFGGLFNLVCYNSKQSIKFFCRHLLKMQKHILKHLRGTWIHSAAYLCLRCNLLWNKMW